LCVLRTSTTAHFSLTASIAFLSRELLDRLSGLVDSLLKQAAMSV